MIELAQFWRLHHPSIAQRTFVEFKEEYLADIEVRVGLTRHYEDLKSKVGIICQTFGDRLPATISRAEALGYLKVLGKGSRTILNFKRAACNYFNWLVEKQVLTENPFGSIKKRQLPRKKKEIEFLKHGKWRGTCELVSATTRSWWPTRSFNSLQA